MLDEDHRRCKKVPRRAELSENEALERGLKEKSEEFVEKSAKVYART
jgi:hypothetical protein